MNVLSLFAGIGGLDLGLERAGMRVVGQVEIDPFCRRVLAKHWPDVPNHDDVRTAADWWLSEERPPVDLICGGFPCQDISNAGRRAGIAGARSGLWAAMRDTVRAIRPRYILMENVPAILVRGLDVVAADLAEVGYDLRWDCIPAAAVGANHRRDRWFGIAYPHRDVLREQPVAERRGSGPAVVAVDGQLGDVADADRIGRDGRTGIVGQGRRTEPKNRRGDMADSDRTGREAGSGLGRPWPAPVRDSWWAVEPDMGRVAHGVPGRVDRVRALGNAVVPQVAEHVGRLIMTAGS